MKITTTTFLAEINYFNRPLAKTHRLQYKQTRNRLFRLWSVLGKIPYDLNQLY